MTTNDPGSPPWRAHSVDTVARILDVPRSQVYALVQGGQLAHARVGKHIRVPDSALRAFVGQAPDPEAVA